MLTSNQETSGNIMNKPETESTTTETTETTTEYLPFTSADVLEEMSVFDLNLLNYTGEFD
jgi:hypothetical protein